MSDLTRVCVVLEGSYPFITGGVSAWVHDLIRGLPDVEFALFTISPTKDQELRYEVPDNVVEHRDVVLSEMPAKSRKHPQRGELLTEIKSLHQRMFAGASAHVERLFELHPDGYYLHSDAVKSDIGWDLITETNRSRNPLYPFADYYWAWKSAHDMLFTTLGAEPPDADIYHAVSTGFAGIAAVGAKVHKHRPFLLTEHGLYHKEREMEIRKSGLIRGYQRDMWISMYNSLSRICYSHADRITALFEDNRRRQIELGAAADRTIVIPNGIDVERFSVKRTPKPEGFHVGLVGRVVPIKDIKTYIATAKIVLADIPDAQFYCIGPTDEDPAYFEDCRLLVESMRIQDNFHFTGRQNVLEYYSFLDVMMLTSVREAQPLVILEAYCAGVPVVATRVGNVPELLDYDDRLIASSKDSTRLADGVRFLHDNPREVERMRTENRRRVLKLYDKKELHERFAELYREMAAAGRDGT